MIQSGKFDNKKILLVDKDTKQRNDRTWCFWETQAGLFEPIVYKKWSHAWFHNKDFSRLLELAPYEYKLIRGIDYYNYCLGLIESSRNITVRYGYVEKLGDDNEGTHVLFDGEKIYAEYIFNSIFLCFSIG